MVGHASIIFENKIYNANDQEAQLARYIDRTRAENYEEEEIYVVYLSQTDQAPDKQSWGRYQTSFADRYVNLSFRNHILPWLKGDVLPNVRQKDAYLQSALVQYIDYLEGLLPRKNPTCVWRYFDIHDYDGVYRCFLRVVDRCLTLADRT